MIVSPDGKILKSEAAHGTITSHFRQHQQGIQTSTNPIASIFAWTRALKQRAIIDDNSDLLKFSDNLENICIDTIDNGFMTKDLALMCGPEQKWITTNEFFDIIKNKIEN